MTLKLTLTDLAKAKERKWDSISQHDTLLFRPDTRKHDSGYRLIKVWGLNYVDCKPELTFIGCCDDLRCYKNELPQGFGVDCITPANVFQFHSWTHRIEIEASLSTTSYKWIPKERA